MPRKRQHISVFQLFRYATCLDRFLILLGVLCSTISGVSLPFVLMLFGEVAGDIVSFASTLRNNSTQIQRVSDEQKLMASVTRFAVYTSLLGFEIIAMMFVSTLVFSYTSLKQIQKIRSLYMKHVMDQDMSWYDTNQTGDFSSRITEDMAKLEEALGDKNCTLCYYMSLFVGGIILAVIKGWELALICLLYLPVSIVGIVVIAWLTTKFAKKGMDSYASAGAVAEEVLGAVRTVVAFGGQRKEAERYAAHLKLARNNSIKQALFAGVNNALTWFLVYSSYALSFFYGIGLVLEERQLPEDQRVYTPGNMLAVFICVAVASWNIGQCAPYFQILSVACSAAAAIYGVIDNVPVINVSKGTGKQFANFKGNIAFNNVYFHYPSRMEVQILNGVSLKVNAGETVAFVGSSGCGKSTCIQLIQRFYDPVAGNVTVDNFDLRELDLNWMRSHIGVVGQEPALFATTIAENIKLGNPSASAVQVERAAMRANAHSFIVALPHGYDTMIGERGAQLSGGQKQRIAIARALVREPAVLLLDEATSALDTESEALVQKAIDSASENCTTIIVAHRLSTIRKANRILVFSEGKVVEEGTHKDLMALKAGAYYNLVTAQLSSDVADNQIPAETDDDDSGNKDPSEDLKESTYDVKDLHTEEYEVEPRRPVRKILKMNNPEWLMNVLGCLAAAVNGASLPFYSVIFGDVVGILAEPNADVLISKGSWLCLMFLVLGVVTGVAAFVQWYAFGVAGEKLTKRVRLRMFEAMLQQEMGWFDLRENGVGALCAKLSGEASNVQGASGQPIGTALNSLSTLCLSVGFSLYFEWRLTLVTVTIVPLVLFAIYMEQKLMKMNATANSDSLKNSTKIAVEAISGIRTIASLGCEETFCRLYRDQTRLYYTKANRSSYFRGLVLGLARSLTSFCYAASIYYGGFLITTEHLEYSRVFKVSEALITGAWSIGNAFAFSRNFQKGISAAGDIVRLLERVPRIKDHESASSYGWGNGDLVYSDVKFAYPTRPDTKVLRGLDLSITHGKTVALVGQSGCGKSTVVQLLERFYDPVDGYITVDKSNISHLKLATLRSYMGMVSQEPNLFDRTIADNIAYGDNTRSVHRHEIIDAAVKANIHNFVRMLPMGYETRLGEKGTQLSGGQKQRIAIARALIRNPQVLLLDEATSALDTESEKIVQEALDVARKGRTCITIAHRLLTIRDVDVICVVHKGRVAEMGTHEDLIALKGIYHKLYSLQMSHA